MATYLALRSKNERLPRLSGELMQSRWRTYMKKFRSTLKLSKTGTGLDLTQRDMDLGISVEDKLEQKCPQFQRMNEIFGEIPSFKPAKTLELGLPTASFQRDQNPAFNKNEAPPNDEVGSDASTDYGDGISNEQMDHPQLPEDDGCEDHYGEEIDCSRTERRQGIVAVIRGKADNIQVPSRAASKSLPLLSSGIAGVRDDLIPTEELFNGNEYNQQRTGVASNEAGALSVKTQRSKKSSKMSGTKRSSDDQAQARKKGEAKKMRTTTHQIKLSLVEAYLDMNLKKQDMHRSYMYGQLEFNKQKWSKEKKEKQRQQDLDRERRVQELKSTERHHFFLALIKEGKSTSEIQELVGIYDRGA